MESNHEKKQRDNAFSLVCDIVVKKSCFFYVELRSFINNF